MSDPQIASEGGLVEEVLRELVCPSANERLDLVAREEQQRRVGVSTLSSELGGKQSRS